ncbi:MAG: glycosyltransferase family 2 protein [Elusimicrobia bacterium]|nr:glycosyltransferase family 2 protein [Elusimicrobiota bacterium]
MSGRRIGVVVPVFNEAESLPEFKRRLSAVLDASGMEYAVILVDDGSRDASLALMREFHRQDPRWKALSLSRNFGHGAACTSGLDHIDADAVVLIDADLQDPPELIAEFIQKWREGHAVVFGARTGRSESWLRRSATSVFYRLLNGLSATPLPLDAGIYSLLDRTAVESLRRLPERHRYLTGLRSWVGFSQVHVPYERRPRHASQPKQSLLNLVLLACDAIFSFSNAPLRLATILGLAMAAGAFLFSLNVLYEKLFTAKPIIGWSSTMVLISWTGGMILFTLGIIGEYVGRIYNEIKQRPVYLVQEKVGI